jgi:TetR/AcrR family transcriptional regulator, lmrAB and yxaGH operons repressor
MVSSLPPTSAATRERVIAATILLMRRRGYAGIGINDILAEGNAPKGSLYHFFPEGKQQIVGEALEIYAAQALQMYADALASAGTPGQKVKRLLKLPAGRLSDANYQASCPAGTVCLDLDDSLDAVRTVVQRFFEQMIDLVATHLRISDRRRARSFAGLLMTVIEGAYIRGRAERSTRAFDEAATWLAEMADALGHDRPVLR